MSRALLMRHGPNMDAVPALLTFTASEPPIGYYARTPTSGPERTLVERCAAQISACGSQAAPLALFFEPAMTQGYPDLVVTYDPAHYAQWRLPRLQLERADLRLIAFLQSQATVDLGAILATHCGERRPVLRRLLRLAEAGIIVEQNGAWRVVAPMDVLGVRHIQAIEAKMPAVPRLIEQALHHSFYATETVLLLPHARLSLALTQAVERHGLGIWVQTPTACQRVRDATPASLRVSVESLRLNEWIGRRLVADGRVVPLPALEVDAAAWCWPTTAMRSPSRFQQLCFGASGTVDSPAMGGDSGVVAPGCLNDERRS
ncbi:MAG: hypothetical protein H0X24_09910 [Ktedonobacterales bacterium]|nr:hypothetical protein [Ktedonobacterales bacterium]